MVLLQLLCTVVIAINIDINIIIALGIDGRGGFGRIEMGLLLLLESRGGDSGMLLKKVIMRWGRDGLR